MRQYQVVGLGNAIVDVLSQTGDDFLQSEGLAKGSMTLIDEQRAHQLYAGLKNPVERSGGSAANTLAGVASLGGRGAYIGKVHADALGQAFAAGMREAGTDFETPPLQEGAPTARCMVLVTPDAQRTMCTYLGACVELTPQDVDEELVKNSQVTYLEGYLWDPPKAKEAFLRACNIAHSAGNRVSLSLSDAFCVDRYRSEFQDLVEHHVDVLFANEAELLSLYQTPTFEEALKVVQGKCAISALTRSEKGSWVVTERDVIHVPAERVSKVVDTTGAGDLYAAGFLHGLTTARPLSECARLGSLSAAEVISHFGARPEVGLAQWVDGKL